MDSWDWQKDKSLGWRGQELGQESRRKWYLLGKEVMTGTGTTPETYISRKKLCQIYSV